MEATYQPLTPENTLWDVIIIGTGMGGATIGYTLAAGGKNVLFLEMGKASKAQNLPASFIETVFPEAATPGPEHQEILKNAGRYPYQLRDVTRPKKPRDFIPLIGSGLGGSTMLYGMVLERFPPTAFTPGLSHRSAHDANIPDAWPISYDEMVPYYARAEKLFRVKGEHCPLTLPDTTDPGDALPAAPRGRSEASNQIAGHLRAQGLHPYQLPLACDFALSCQTCQGYLCQNQCKNNADRVCLETACRDHGAFILEMCEVVRLHASADHVDEIECLWNGNPLRLQANRIILAAGAIETPRLLLRSKSALWPDGVANKNRLVGKNLMRHLIDLILIKRKRPSDTPFPPKDLGFNDFYVDQDRLGTVQSFGALPPNDVLIPAIIEDVRHSPVPFMAPLLKLISPILAHVFNYLRKHYTVMALILEDMPALDNKITLPETKSSLRMQLRYKIGLYDQSRMDKFRARVIKALKPYQTILLKSAHNNQLIAHACGTCRMGNDPITSVVDQNNQVHGIDNLYIVDASFFPSSGGVNPSLTIAANALRVADIILKQGRYARIDDYSTTTLRSDHAPNNQEPSPNYAETLKRAAGNKK